MANDNAPSGFTPWGPILQIRSFDVRGNYNFPYFIGDVMGFQTDGYVTAVVGGSTLICGSNLTFVTGAVTGTVRIACDPNQLFWAQDNTSGTLTIAAVGLNVDHLYAEGSINTKRSKTVVATQTTDPVATAAGFKLTGLLDRTNSDGTRNGYGAYNKVVVIPDEHVFKYPMTGY